MAFKGIDFDNLGRTKQGPFAPTKWKKVTAGADVHLKGKIWTVEKITVKKKRVEVELRERGTKRVHRGQVDPDKKVSAAIWYTEPKTETKVTRNAGPDWLAKPESKAERNVVKILSGKLDGIQPAPGEWYICPPVDVSTIAAHLLVFHDIELVDVRRVGGYEDALAIHVVEHARKPSLGPLAVPHYHDERQPEVAIVPIPD